MHPVFAQNHLLLDVLVASYFIWALTEASVQIWQRKRFRAGAQRRDKGSYVILRGMIQLGNAFCILLAFMVPATTITGERLFLFWSGIALVCVGLAFRLYAITVLGRYFTTSVAVVADQRVVEDGPYRLIRHPSYTGLLILCLGFGLCSTNWLSLLVLMGCVLIGLSYRIHIEEYALQAHLGLPYEQYMQHTKRFIPFVL